MWTQFLFLLTTCAAPTLANTENCKGEPGSGYCMTPLYHFHDNVKSHVAKQVNREIDASLFYMELAAHFGRDDVNRKGFAKFFMHQSDEEREHAKKFSNYLNARDGSWTGYTPSGSSALPRPQPNDMQNGLSAIRYALNLEKEVSNKLTDLHHMANKYHDIHLADFLEGDLLREQVESVRDLTGMMHNLEAMYVGNDGLAEYLYDLELQKRD